MKQLALNRNEVLQGPSPEVLAALKDFKLEYISLYLEDYYYSTLIPKISESFAIPEDQVVISYGEEDFLRTVFDTLVPGRDSVLTQAPHYSYYGKYLDFKGIMLNTFNMTEGDASFSFDIENALEQCKQTNPKIILLTSPNNPTGNAISAGELEQILKVAPQDTLVIVDEAYWGFDAAYDQQGFISLLQHYPNLVLLRSFSKLYALAGLRIGFALCGTQVKSLLRYQNRYLGMSRILEHVAIAALDSHDYYANLASKIVKDREALIAGVRSLNGFKVFDSKANFVLIRIEDAAILQKLQMLIEKEEVTIAKGVGENLLRVSVGEEKYTTKFLELVRQAV